MSLSLRILLMPVSLLMMQAHAATIRTVWRLYEQKLRREQWIAWDDDAGAALLSHAMRINDTIYARYVWWQENLPWAGE